MTYLKLSKIFRTAVLIFVILLPHISKAQVVKILTDSNNVEFGNPVHLIFSVFDNSGRKIKYPVFKDNKIIDGIEILDYLEGDTTCNKVLKAGGEIRSYLITSYEDSTFVIPPLPILFDKDTVWTDSLKVTFTLLHGMDSTLTSEIDTTKFIQIFDIKPVKDAPWTFAEFWARFGRWIIVTLIVLLVGAVIGYMYMRWKNNKPIIPILKPKEPADKTAYKQLCILKDAQLWQKGKTKDYYSRLTEILKTYITDRYGISVMECTSDETLDILKLHCIDSKSEAYQGMKDIFEVADFVKFAKLEPLPDQNDTSLSLAFKFVEITKIVEVANDSNSIVSAENQQVNNNPPANNGLN
jgi:hypothetical protein